MKSLTQYIAEAINTDLKKSYITEVARMKPIKNVPQDQTKAWFKKELMRSSKCDREKLDQWNDNVTFEDVYNLIRKNGPEDPEKGVYELIWTKDASDIPYWRQWLYRALAERYNIHGGKIDLGHEYSSGMYGSGVDYKNFLTKWIHE